MDVRQGVTCGLMGLMLASPALAQKRSKIELFARTLGEELVEELSKPELGKVTFQDASFYNYLRDISPQETGFVNEGFEREYSKSVKDAVLESGAEALLVFLPGIENFANNIRSKKNKIIEDHATIRRGKTSFSGDVDFGSTPIGFNFESSPAWTKASFRYEHYTNFSTAGKGKLSISYPFNLLKGQNNLEFHTQHNDEHGFSASLLLKYTPRR